MPRRWALLLVVLLLAKSTIAQTLRDFPYADSLTQALTEQGRWQALDSVGQAALALGTDYPALRQRLGYGALQRQRPAAAIWHYGRAVRGNPTDEESRYQLAVAYLQLLQPGAARLAARPLPDSLRLILHLPARRAVTQVGAEAGWRPSPSRVRGAAGFGRLLVSSQLSTRLALTQAVAYYGQTVQLPARGELPTYQLRQGEYSALLVAQLALPWQLKLGYHYIYNDFGERHYHTHLAYTAVRYARPYWQAQAGLYAGRVTDTARVQTDLLLTAYPLGNLRLYVFGRGSLLRSSGRTYPSAVLGAGARVRPQVWAEAYWGPGAVPVLFEQDGAYVYNLLDPLRYRWGGNGYWQLTPHWRLAVYYTLGRYREIRSPFFYTQHSLTGGFAWTW